MQSLTREILFWRNSIQKYEEIAEVLKFVLTLSHGQASLERDFSRDNTVV